MFFNSKGKIRPKEFKAQYYNVLLREIDLLGLENPYQFINSSLNGVRGERFVPEVHTGKHYSFWFEVEKDQFGQGITKRLLIDDVGVSERDVLYICCERRTGRKTFGVLCYYAGTD